MKDTQRKTPNTPNSPRDPNRTPVREDDDRGTQNTGANDDRETRDREKERRFPGAVDRPDTERLTGNQDTQYKPRRHDQPAEPVEPNQEPYMGKKHDQ